MDIAACNLSIVPLRAEASHRSEMVTQVLFGEQFEIIEEGIDFTFIRLLETNYEGWIQKNQFERLTEEIQYEGLVDIFGMTATAKDRKVHLVHGTPISSQHMTIGKDIYNLEGASRNPSLDDLDIEFPKLITHYKNTPYMWGGRSTAGIDCSGFSQVIYKHFGISLLRDAYQQAESGSAIDFLTEIKAGDLAFFDNEAGRITHVGVMIDNETIIHAAGHVRVDKMDNQGIFNLELNKYTHRLRIVKRYF